MFETGSDRSPEVLTVNSFFTKDQREPFRYSDVETLLSRPQDIVSMIRRFLEVQLPRLEILESYDSGNNYGITKSSRRKFKDRPDNKASHNHAGYISIMQNAYMFGVPVRVEHSDKDIMKFITEYSEINDVESLNSSLGYDCSRYGRAYELQMRNSDDEDKTFLSPVFETFVIYDTTVQESAIAAVRFPRYRVDDQEYMSVTVYTEDKIITYDDTGVETIQLFNPVETYHSYGGIPIIEWRNNRERIGDYEKVIPLIDLYDAAQSDTANYMQEMNDALLLLTGDIDLSKYSNKDMSEMLKAGMMMLSGNEDISGRPTPVDGKYLYKQYDVMGKEAYNKRLENDIHKFTHTPDLSDENFVGNASGIAIKYKLFGLEQTRSIKERYYTKALRRRYQLISNLHNSVSEIDLKYRELNIIFSENIPNNIWDEIESFYKVGGELSLETMLDQLTFVNSTHDELTRIEDSRSKEYDDFDGRI